MPAIQALSMKPIIFSQVPPIDTVLSKLTASIDSSSAAAKENIKSTLTKTVIPYLKARFSSSNASAPLLSAKPEMLVAWVQASVTSAGALPIGDLFPLVDMWRLAFLDPAVGTWTAQLILPASSTPNPATLFLGKAAVANNALAGDKGARNFLLTTLRLLCNAFSSPTLARRLLQDVSSRAALTEVLVPSLLHADAQVRTAAASLAFNVAATVQVARVEAVRTGKGGREEDEDGEGAEEWRVEIVSALLEAVDREKASEEVGASSFR